MSCYLLIGDINVIGSAAIVVIDHIQILPCISDVFSIFFIRVILSQLLCSYFPVKRYLCWFHIRNAVVLRNHPLYSVIY